MKPLTIGQEKFLLALAIFGLVVPNGIFLYYALGAPAALFATLRDPVALVFITEAFVLMFLFAWFIHRLGLRAPGWFTFILMSLVGSMVFSVPAVLYLASRNARKSLSGCLILRTPANESLPIGAVTAFRLSGSYDFRVQISGPGIIRSAPILASQILSDEEMAHARECLASPDSYGGVGARCFIPRLGFTLGAGADAVDVLICVECDRAHFFRGDVRTETTLSPEGRLRFAEIQQALFPNHES